MSTKRHLPSKGAGWFDGDDDSPPPINPTTMTKYFSGGKGGSAFPFLLLYRKDSVPSRSPPKHVGIKTAGLDGEPKVQYASLAGNSCPAGSDLADRVNPLWKYLVSGILSVDMLLSR